jgi:hypothetical protein
MSYTDLLKGNIPAESLDRVETLNETLSRAAADWTMQDLETIVAGLRTQREKWNEAQAAGSRKLVRSSNVAGNTIVKKGKFSGLAAGLSKVKV